MKLLDKYILREMVVPFLIGQASIVMMLTGTVLYNNAELFLVHQVRVVDVIRMVLYFIPFLVHMTMPVAMAVAASLAVSRLTRDSEITVVRASGVSLMRLFLPIFAVGLLVSIGDFYFGEYVVPAAMNRFYAVRAEIPNRLRELTPLTGQFIASTDQTFGLYVHSVARKKDYIELNEVQIFNTPKAYFGGDKQPMLAMAKRGRYIMGRWILENPTIFRFNPNGQDFTRLTPKTASYDILVDPQSFNSSFLMQMPMGTMANNASRTFTELGMDIQRNRKQNIQDVYTLLDYHFKLSVPFSCLVMALCCPPLALRFGRGGGFMGTLLSISLVFVYWNTLLLMRILGTPGAQGTPPILPPAAAAWSQNVLFVLLGLIVLRKSE